MAAKAFIDGELAKYETWDELPESLIKLLKTGSAKQDLIAFANVKSRGSGQFFTGGADMRWRFSEDLRSPFRRAMAVAEHRRRIEAEERRIMAAGYLPERIQATVADAILNGKKQHRTGFDVCGVLAEADSQDG